MSLDSLLYHDRFSDRDSSSSDAMERPRKRPMNQVTLRRPITPDENSLPNLAFRNTGAECILWIYRYSFDVFVATSCIIVILFVLPSLESLFDLEDVSIDEAEQGLLLATKRLNDALNS